ncbi:hypothetical protein UA18_03575 [Burkholderia multivorans]|uniref:Bacteriophage protein n=1 Tax=Burkholderia multivorans TaxID=87883 RepID=A0ABD7L6X1_9BURK|nr:hypothetical protein UA18_03575 [Burkholderia multivorans]
MAITEAETACQCRVGLVGLRVRTHFVLDCMYDCIVMIPVLQTDVERRVCIHATKRYNVVAGYSNGHSGTEIACDEMQCKVDTC